MKDLGTFTNYATSGTWGIPQNSCIQSISTGTIPNNILLQALKAVTAPKEQNQN
jgi:hypothetical protein